MKRIHDREKAQFKKLLKQGGVVNIDKRLQILEVFLATEKHVTALEVESLLEKNKKSFGIDFVTDTLKLMVRYGFAEPKRFDTPELHYEHRHIGLHHDHMICTKCRKIVEFKDDDIESLQKKVAKQQGFHMLLHKMEIYGICSDCMKDQSLGTTLDLATPGNKLVIREYSGVAKVSMRLIHMGLRIGDEIEVITNSGQGQVVVAVGYNRYILDRKLARRVVVEQSG